MPIIHKKEHKNKLNFQCNGIETINGTQVHTGTRYRAKLTFKLKVSFLLSITLGQQDLSMEKYRGDSTHLSKNDCALGVSSMKTRAVGGVAPGVGRGEAETEAGSAERG